MKKTQKHILKDVELLFSKVNIMQANTGVERDVDKHYIDCISGIMAEFAILEYLENLNLPYNISRPIVKTSFNQIDILLEEQITSSKYTIEVRSSFLKNGMYFALYAINAKTGRSYFDVIETYKQNAYKVNFEPDKDFYMRVFYDLDGENYYEFLKNKSNFI